MDDDGALASPSLHKTLSHPVRYAILMIVSEREASSKQLSEELDESFPRVCEHVRDLRKWGYIEVVRTSNDHGGSQQFYRAVRRPVFDAVEWAKMPLPVRVQTTDNIVSRIIKDIAASISSGRFDRHPRRALLRMSVAVDEEGFAEADESALRHLAELGRIEARSSERRAASGEESRYLRTATLVFEAGPEAEIGHGVGSGKSEPDVDKLGPSRE
jgi:DNA-binding transcriptional ArsR family regulator